MGFRKSSARKRTKGEQFSDKHKNIFRPYSLNSPVPFDRCLLEK